MNKKVDIHYEDKNDRRIIFFPKTFDISNSTALKDYLKEISDDTKKDIVLDLKDTGFIDSSGVGVIILLLKDLMEQNRKLYITNPKGIVKESLDMSKIFKFIDLI
ncbi:MAG: STAS domain-containing protein [bacterium]